MLYAQRAGLDPLTVIRSVGNGAAASWGINHLGPKIAARDFAPGFYVEHFLKDKDIALREGKRMGLAPPGAGGEALPRGRRARPRAQRDAERLASAR